MIETINLTKKYGDLVALSNLNLVINEGDCFGFIGPNGAGKTTTIKILATLLKPSSGQANVAGLTIGYQNRQIRPLIGYVPDFMGAYEDMVVTEYLEFFAASYGIHGTQRDKVVKDVLELTDLTYKATAEVNSLSRGMQQRLSVARVLLHDPKVLLMDEPASGLDPRARIEMRELLKELRRMGKTILISSHILPELAELCNVVGIIERGQLLFSGTVDEIVRRARMGHILHVGVTDRIDDAAKVVGGFPGVKKVAVSDVDSVGSTNGARQKVIVVDFDAAGGRNYTDIPNVLVNAGFRLTKFTEEPVNLETAFMRLTKGLVQ
ncbi:MAG: ABC transporter ATP-binding protein [Phycisphaerales bacterium]|jgi:ABC-2 type transport system ATP-binding protein|nr:ABC transporter ATP-binding protein [Phycisphaerales bacterium]